MQRPIPWLWITLIGVLLIAPGLAGRLFVDVLEGITLLLVLGPLVLGGAGFLAWQWFKRRIVTCPACGADLSQVRPVASAAKPVDAPASDAVVDVQVQDVTDR